MLFRSDSDGGDRPNVFGKVTFKRLYYEDKCSATPATPGRFGLALKPTLTEYLCVDKKALSQAYECTRCAGGVCQGFKKVGAPQPVR